MKAWKTLTAACAVLAVAPPMANATFDRSLPATAPKAKVAKKVHHTRLAPKLNATTPRVLIIVAQGPTPGVADRAGDCARSGSNCSDQQLCDMWAMSCDFAAGDQANNAATEDQSITG
jgi:hypothetical protein